jgi:hypothetical protein
MTTEIEKVSTLNDTQAESLAKAEAELKTLATEIESKKYLLSINDADMDLLRQFILKDAQWKFTEALGIVEIEKELKLAKSSDGNYYLGAIATEAIYYYMSKIEGNGKKVKSTSITSVDVYLRILRGITSSIEFIKKDTEKRNKLEFEVAARREGIEPESSNEE